MDDILDELAAPGNASAGTRRRKARPPEGPPRLAWGLFLVVGVPFVLMGALTVLARDGVYVDVFKPLWAPWPPEVLKPFLGFAGFFATLAYLVYRLGHRTGYRAGAAAGRAAVLNAAEAEMRDLQPAPPAPEATELVPVPPGEGPATVQPVPPPPTDAPADEDL